MAEIRLPRNRSSVFTIETQYRSGAPVNALAADSARERFFQNLCAWSSKPVRQNTFAFSESIRNMSRKSRSHEKYVTRYHMPKLYASLSSGM